MSVKECEIRKVSWVHIQRSHHKLNGFRWSKFLGQKICI